MTRTRAQGTVIVGAGPGGLAPLLASASRGDLNELLDRGVTVLESSFAVGAGALGQYGITSDSAAHAILDIVTHSKEPILTALCLHPTVQAVAAYGSGAVPLQLVGQFLKLVGETLCQKIASTPNCQVLLGARAHWVQQTRDGQWRTSFTDATGRTQTVRSCSVVLATGAHQPLARLQSETVGGMPLLPVYQDKVVQSGDVLTATGLAQLARRFQGTASPRVAVVGGSTSAAAIVLALLTRLPAVAFDPGAVTLLHRRPLRLFYESIEEALRDGYTEFSAGDVCALTGRVFRLAGFRLDSRELIMRVRGLAGRAPENRVRLLDLNCTSNEDTTNCLAEADLIIAAMGYRPRLLPVLDPAMDSVPLHLPHAGRWAAVDELCRVMTAKGRALPGLFAMGLAVGPAATRELGGELDFHGQINSLWLWQHTLGERVATQLIDRVDANRTMGQRSAETYAEMDASVLQTVAFTPMHKMAGAA